MASGSGHSGEGGQTPDAAFSLEEFSVLAEKVAVTRGQIGVGVAQMGGDGVPVDELAAQIRHFPRLPEGGAGERLEAVPGQQALLVGRPEGGGRLGVEDDVRVAQRGREVRVGRQRGLETPVALLQGTERRPSLSWKVASMMEAGSTSSSAPSASNTGMNG